MLEKSCSKRVRYTDKKHTHLPANAGLLSRGELSEKTRCMIVRCGLYGSSKHEKARRTEGTRDRESERVQKSETRTRESSKNVERESENREPERNTKNTRRREPLTVNRQIQEHRPTLRLVQRSLCGSLGPSSIDGT
jgi:hypothetical protein